jgi:hypothetical protein
MAKAVLPTFRSRGDEVQAVTNGWDSMIAFGLTPSRAKQIAKQLRDAIGVAEGPPPQKYVVQISGFWRVDGAPTKSEVKDYLCNNEPFSDVYRDSPNKLQVNIEKLTNGKALIHVDGFWKVFCNAKSNSLRKEAMEFLKVEDFDANVLSRKFKITVAKA